MTPSQQESILRLLFKKKERELLANWRLISLLNAGANCKIINNSWFSECISLDHGVRQGCPLSPLLYTIAIETLANAIQKHPGIEGVQVPGNQKCSKVSAYVDDSTLTLRDDLSVTQAFDVIHKFERASGSKLNLSKTTELYYISGDRALAKKVWQKTWRISISKVPLKSLNS